MQDYDFKKTDKQKEAIRLLANDSKFTALLGGSRSGKTFILLYAMIIRASKVRSRHLIVRQNFNHIKRSIALDTFPKVLRTAFPKLRPVQNKTDLFYTLNNGSEIYLAGLDDGKRVEKILGTEYSTIWFNEASQIDYASTQVAITRLAEKNDLKKKIWYDFNPPNKTHWSYWLFQKKLDPVEEVTLQDPENYQSLLMNPNDNLENIDQDYLNLLSKMPEKERNRFLLGLFNDESDGVVYYSFKREEHVAPVTKTNGTLFVGMDFNVDPMTAVIFQFIDNKIMVHDEIYLNNSDTYKMSAALKAKGLGGATIFPDSTGVNRKTSGMSDFQILKEAGFKIESTRNPFVFDRVNNVNRLFQANKIVIDPKCRKLINDLEKVSWKDNKLDQSGPNKHLTHISDCLGYACWALDPINPSVAKVEFYSPSGRKL
jgi:PBSX family phage terminase large subunit